MKTKSQSPDIYYAVAHRSQQEIDSFATRYQNFDTNVIYSIFKKDLKLDVTEIQQTESWGTSHVIYYIKTKQNPEELVFRANLGVNPQPEIVMLAEQLITDQVASAGVPTNRVLHVDVSRKDFPFDYQIQEKLKGNDLEDHFKGTQQDYDRFSYHLGELVAKYHSIKLPGWGLFDEVAVMEGKLRGTKQNFYDYIVVCLDDDLKYLVEAKVISSKQSSQIVNRIEEARLVFNIPQGVLIHHDLADHNIMIEGSKITGIFDWEAAVVGDPILDLASCPTWRTHYPREEQLLAGYESITKLPDNFQIRHDICLLRTMIWKGVFGIRMNILTNERRQRLFDILELFNI